MRKVQSPIQKTVEFKPLNKVIIIVKYPIPTITELYERAASAWKISKINIVAKF